LFLAWLFLLDFFSNYNRPMTTGFRMSSRGRAMESNLPKFSLLFVWAVLDIYTQLSIVIPVSKKNATVGS
ncbi:hypothetical protein QUA40_24925, partial [Microcoleus sp. Pol11C3]|uniref:hypothetical protein n=1 Tax=Microcoleus sp. Pol11C3 TaxID=3055390 RepID=UPI002FD54142